MADGFLDDIGVSLGAPKAKTYAPLDAALRTVYAEAPPKASPDELKAIASVIANRAKKSGKDVGAVVQEPGQFESWKNGRDRIDGLDEASPDYAALQGTVGDILSGKAQPTTAATLFYAPEAQAAMAPKDGRPAKPEWDDGSGTRIGSHLFFDPGAKGSGGDAFLADIGVDHKALAGEDPDKAELTSEHLIDPAGTIQPGTITKQQQAARDTLFKGGGIDAKADPGSLYHPFFLGAEDKPENAPAGSYYIDQKGHMGRVPGGDKESSVGAGLGRGALDVAESVGNLMPGTGDSEILARLHANNMQYGAKYGGDLMSGLGRFTGQVGASLPLMAGAEAAVVPGLTRFLGPAGSFLAGTAGKAALPATAGAGARVGQLALRAGSLAASGAQEGAGASLLTHAADDRPLGEQVATGAVLGAGLKPVATVLGKGMKRFIGGPDLAGADDVAAQRELAAKAGSLPVRPPLSLGDLTGAPGQQMAENALRRGVDGDAAAGVVQAFDAGQDAALRANVDPFNSGRGAITDLIAGAAHEAGAGGKMASDKLNAMGRGGLWRKGGSDRPRAVRRPDQDLEPHPVERRGRGGSGARGEVRDGWVYRERLEKGPVRRRPEGHRRLADAIGKRAAMGKLFEGDDLIEALTERVQRGGGSTLKVDPEEATNYILGRSALGFLGKRNLGRDLKRLQGVLGKDSDEWNALRSEAFMRIGARRRGRPEARRAAVLRPELPEGVGTRRRRGPAGHGDHLHPEERELIASSPRSPSGPPRR
jgi:hypothetical protein